MVAIKRISVHGASPPLAHLCSHTGHVSAAVTNSILQMGKSVWQRPPGWGWPGHVSGWSPSGTCACVPNHCAEQMACSPRTCMAGGGVNFQVFL